MAHEIGSSKKRPKALVLLSGGLDSMLATKLVMNLGVEMEAVNFVSPFFIHDERLLERFCEEQGVRLNRVFLGQDFLDTLADPEHGYGSEMNPCIDCRILTLSKAKALAEEIEADFIVTGEVLDERPFSQKKEMMLHIEKEAGLKGKVLRPLSAKLLPETEPEKKGLVRREELLAISGRRRVPQIELARELGIREYPDPAGGCLLTDPRFAERLKEHLSHGERLTLVDAELLRVGRHFRVNGAKIVVGRNEEENHRLLSLAAEHGLGSMEVVHYVGPVTLLVGGFDPEILGKAAAITARYSDAPKKGTVKVRWKSRDGEQTVDAEPITDGELRSFRI